MVVAYPEDEHMELGNVEVDVAMPVKVGMPTPFQDMKSQVRSTFQPERAKLCYVLLPGLS